MGLVQSRSEQPENTVEVEGVLFTIEQNLQRLIPMYGDLLIDFRNSFFGENFTVRFSGQGSC
jgi:pheromone shutdown protein TraB